MVNLDLFSFFILLSAINSLVMSGLLLASTKKNRQGNILLALTLIFYTLPVLRVIINDTAFFKDFTNFSFLFVELIFGLGPSLYLYTKSVTNPNFKIQSKEYWHYAPVLAEVIYYFTSSYTQVGRYTIHTSTNIHHAVWMTQQAGAVIVLLVYQYLTIRLLLRYKNWVNNNYSENHQKTLQWLENPIWLYSFFWLAWLAVRGIDIIFLGETLHLNFYYPLLTALSFITCWIGFMGYTKPEVSTPEFALSPNKQPVPGIKPEEQAPLVARLQAAMQTDKLYLDPELSLANLAQHLNMNPKVTSKLINEGIGKNFHDFVNAYRVEEVKNKLLNPKNQHVTFLGLALESGFNSKATFNHIFKKFTGTTPKQFLAKHHQKRPSLP